jgi:hypothetical protein
MAVNTLQDPLIKLDNLPTTMKWGGEWSSELQYYKNDLTISPVDFGSYILSASAYKGGADPSRSEVWTFVGASSGGVENIRKGVGIDLSGSATQPVIINSGVREIQYGTNIQNAGTTQDVVLDTSSIATITGILGIGITNLSTITNLGVTTLDGAGFDFNSPTGQVTMSNTGVMSLRSSDNLLQITPGQNPVILNKGLLSIVDGTAITNVSTTPYQYQLQNDGVRTITYPSNTINNVGDIHTQRLTAANCHVCQVWSTTGAMTPNPIPFNTNDGSVLQITQTPNTLWANCLANGVPYSSGVFELDMTGIVFYASAVGAAQTRITYYLLDGNTQFLLGTDKHLYVRNDTTNTYTLGKVLIDLQKVRAAGIRQLTGFRLIFRTIQAKNPKLSYIQGGKGLAVFSPLGVV